MLSPKYLKTYFREGKKLKREHPQAFSVVRLAKHFLAWQHSLKSGSSPLKDQTPWMTFHATLFLERTLTREMRVYEYGSGGSTLFFDKRVLEVVSVEHDPVWAETVQAALDRENNRHSHLRLVEAEPNELAANLDAADPEAYVSSDPAFRGRSFRNYAASIDAYPSAYFDVILIDGRARPSCFKHAAVKTKTGGWLVLDNAERAEYRAIHASLNNEGWQKRDLAGPGPYNRYFWQTCAWQKMK